MSQYKEYFKYRDTNQPWMEVIPSDWDFLRAKYIFLNSTYKSSEDLVQLAASQKYGVIPQKDLMEKSNRVVQALKGTDGFKEVAPGDFVISLRSFEGGIESSDYHGCISPAYTVLRNRNPYVFDKDFYRYFLKCSIFVQKLNSSSEGIRDGKTITYDQFREIVLPVPNYSEQTAIATFLDRETSRIDRLIDAKKRFIERLKEKRQALISHAVTKGLDPNAPMKDSGVEWIGEIPKGWEVKALKRVSKISPPVSSEVKDNGEMLCSFIPMDSLKETGEVDASISRPLNEMMGKYTYFSEGDVLLAKVTPCFENGKVGVAKNLINGHGFGTTELHVFRSKGILPLFMTYLFRHPAVKMLCESSMQGTGGLKRIPSEFVMSLNIPVPGLDTQMEIIDRIEGVGQRMNYLETKTVRSIDLLKEKREALITAAVTGKIDVRDEA